MPKIDEQRPFLAVNIAVLTVSDTRNEASDKSGQTLIDLLTAGYIEAFRRPDGAIAYRTTPEGRKELGRREGRS